MSYVVVIYAVDMTYYGVKFNDFITVITQWQIYYKNEPPEGRREKILNFIAKKSKSLT